MTHQQGPDNSQSLLHWSYDSIPAEFQDQLSHKLAPQSLRKKKKKNRLNLACYLGIDLGVFTIFVWGWERGIITSCHQAVDLMCLLRLTIELLDQMAPIM